MDIWLIENSYRYWIVLNWMNWRNVSGHWIKMIKFSKKYFRISVREKYSFRSITAFRKRMRTASFSLIQRRLTSDISTVFLRTLLIMNITLFLTAVFLIQWAARSESWRFYIIWGNISMRDKWKCDFTMLRRKQRKYSRKVSNWYIWYTSGSFCRYNYYSKFTPSYFKIFLLSEKKYAKLLIVVTKFSWNKSGELCLFLFVNCMI